jgi:hypothetical protein
MSTIQATVNWTTTIAESFTAAELPAIGALTIVQKANNSVERLNAASTPPVTKAYSEVLTGTQTLDLTALVRSLGATLDCTGLRLQYIRLVNLSLTNYVEIEDGASNPYQLFAGQKVRVLAKAPYQQGFVDGLADVAAGAKLLKFTATAAQTYHVELLFG